MKKKYPEYRNYHLQIGSQFLKQKIETSLTEEDLVVTTAKEDAIVLTFDEALDCQKKINSSYPELMVLYRLAELK